MPPKRKRIVDGDVQDNHPRVDEGSNGEPSKTKGEAAQQQSGGPPKRKKTQNLALLIDAGLLEEGAVLRYMKGRGTEKGDKLWGVGTASVDGVLVHGNSRPLGLSAFEALAGSSAHRPAQFTFTSSGLSLQQLMQQNNLGPRTQKTAVGRWGLTAAGKAWAAREAGKPLSSDDPNDEFCRICLQGGDLLCCESCPGVLHAGCAGLSVVPEGDWHCPHCICAGCGHAGFGERADLDASSAQVTWVEPALLGGQPLWKGPLKPDQQAPVVTVPARPFDLQWFKEGRQAAAVQAATLKLLAVEGTPQADAAAASAPSAVKIEPAANLESRHAASSGAADDKGADEDDREPVSPRSPKAEQGATPRSGSAGRGRGGRWVGRGRGRGRGRGEKILPDDDDWEPGASSESPRGGRGRTPRPASGGRGRGGRWAGRGRARGRGRSTGMSKRALSPELIDTDEFVDMARGAPTKEALADALNESFPEAARLTSASKHLRDLFYTACPQYEWEECANPMAILVETLWKAAAAAEAAEAAEPPKRRCGRGRNRGGRGPIGRPRKVMALSEEPVQSSQSVPLSEAVQQIAASTAPAIALAPQTPMEMANGGLQVVAAPSAGQRSAAPSAAYHAQLMVPRDSDSELDVCSVPEGLPPLLQPSRLGNLPLATPSRDHITAISQPAIPAEQPGDGARVPAPASMPAGSDLAGTHAPETAQQPGAVTTGMAANITRPDKGSMAAPAAATHHPAALAAMAPTNISLGAVQQNGVPGLLAAAGLTGLLAADPSMVVAIAAGASQFLMQGQQQLPLLGSPLATSAAALSASRPLHLPVQAPLLQGSSRAHAHPQPSMMASQQPGNPVPIQQQSAQEASQQGHNQAQPQQRLDWVDSQQGSNVAPPQQQQQTVMVASQQGPDQAPPQQQPSMAASHQVPHQQTPPADIETNGVSEPAPAVKMLGKRASGKIIRQGDVLESVVLPQKAAPAKASSPLLDGIKREMVAHIQQQQAAGQKLAVDVLPGNASAAARAVKQQQPTAHAAAVPAQHSGSAEPNPMEISAAISGAPEQEAAMQLPAADAAPVGPVMSGGAAAVGEAAVLGAPDEGAPLESPPAAPPLTIEEAKMAIGRPVQPSGPAPEGNDAALVLCAGCGQRRHLACVPAAEQVLARQGAWYHSEECRAADAELARLAASGLMPVEASAESTADVSAPAWQLICGAAVSDPQGCRGVAPRYDEAARVQLRAVLYAARHILAEATGGLPDSRTGKDLLPMLLQGVVVPSKQRLVDFSRFHTATLWLGPTLAAAGLVRTHGAEVAEVPVLAVRPELEGNSVGRALLACLESALLAAGVKLLVMPAVSQLPPTTASQGDFPQRWWPSKAGYAPASAQQLALLSALPLLHFPAAPFLAKQLSADTLLKAVVTAELKMSGDVDVASLAKAKLLSPVPLSFYEADWAQRDVKPEAPQMAVVASAQAEKPTGASGNAADAEQVQAGPTDVSADVAADGDVMAGPSGCDNATAVAHTEDVGVPLESAPAERNCEGARDGLIAGKTDGAVFLSAEGIQNAGSVPDYPPEASPMDVVGNLNEPAVPEVK